MAKNDQPKAKGGRSMLKYIAVYFFTWLSGIIALLIAKDDKTLKFHGAQALILGIVIIIVSYIPFVGGIIAILAWIYGIYIGYNAGQGKDIEIPVVADIAKKF